MPTRGYRKGISDTKEPLGPRLHTRLPVGVHAALKADAKGRSMSVSKLLRELAIARYTGQRLSLPQHRGHNSTLLREFSRVANNLNQIAHHANTLNFNPLLCDARGCIALISELARQLRNG